MSRLTGTDVHAAHKDHSGCETDYRERVAEKRASISMGGAGAPWPPQVSNAFAGAAQLPIPQVRSRMRSSRKPESPTDSNGPHTLIATLGALLCMCPSHGMRFQEQGSLMAELISAECC